MNRVRKPMMLLAASVAAATVMVAAPATATAPGAGAKHPALLVAGHWTYFRAESLDGLERTGVMNVAKGGRWVSGFAFTPTGRCAGPRITVLGRHRVKLHKVWYVGLTPTSTVMVTVRQGGTKSQAGLLVVANSSRDVQATVNSPSTTGACLYTFQLHHPKPRK